ncbi:MAG: AI-2E family transporter [Firmicutes bacterium]|nr:AI-2E family transporter [Bacillota bacterium]
MKRERNSIMPFIKLAGEIILVLILLTILLLYIYRHREILYFVLTPFIIALVIAYVLNPLVDFMEKRRLSRALAILVIYTAFGLIVLVVCLRFLPNLLDDLQGIAANFPHYARKAHEHFLNFQDNYRRFNLPPRCWRLLSRI